MSNLYFQVCGFFVWALITIIYFSKQRIKSLETKIYVGLLFDTFFALFFDITIILLTYLLDMDVIVDTLKILNKFYFTTILLWVVLLKIYVFNVSFSFKEKNNRIYNILKYIDTFIFLISVIIIFILPVNIFNENNVMYSYGESLNFMFVVIGIYVLMIIASVIIKIKDIKNKKYTPIYILILLILINMVINRVSPGLLLTTPIMSYIVLLMYHTIENPDMKLINELNIAKSQAEKANNAKTEFLSSMSHEIRTPLNAIVGFSQALQEENLPESAKEEVKDIIMASENLLEIVNGILDISKIEANKLEIVNTEYDFNKVLDELVALAKGRLGDKPLEFRTSFDRTTPQYLYGDYIRLKQIVINLLTNSIKYTKEGFIELKVNSVVKDDVCRLIISVEDSGIGIPQDKIDKLFTKFERFDLEKNITIEGTGLGLAITKKLVELMNGQIVVQSVYGKGSKFTVAIDQKIVKDPTALIEQENKKNATKAINIAGKKILVVDDNKINLKVANRILKSYNVEITEATSGQECLDKVNSSEQFDLILLDDMMPKMNGVQTLKELKKINNFNIPVIAFTANAISGMKAKYLSEGFDDYLSKPIEKEELNNVLRKFLVKD